MIRIRSKAALVLMMSAIVLLVPGLLIATYALKRLEWADHGLASIASRYARLGGLAEAAPQIEKAMAAATLQFSELAFPASLEPGLAATRLQQRIRQLAASTGVSIVTMQDLPPRANEGFDTVLVTVNATGAPDSMHHFVTGLQQHPPRLFVDSVTFGNMPARVRGQDPNGDLISRMTIGTYRLQP